MNNHRKAAHQEAPSRRASSVARDVGPWPITPTVECSSTSLAVNAAIEKRPADTIEDASSREHCVSSETATAVAFRQSFVPTRPTAKWMKLCTRTLAKRKAQLKPIVSVAFTSLVVLFPRRISCGKLPGTPEKKKSRIRDSQISKVHKRFQRLTVLLSDRSEAWLCTLCKSASGNSRHQAQPCLR
eukprot:SAG31_NODE_457_length_15415_cov_4.380387_20_plen_185_part_00